MADDTPTPHHAPESATGAPPDMRGPDSSDDETETAFYAAAPRVTAGSVPDDPLYAEIARGPAASDPEIYAEIARGPAASDPEIYAEIARGPAASDPEIYAENAR